MSASILATVITYHPTEECLKNILSYYSYVKEIILVDNTETENSIFLESLEPFNKITVIKRNSNLGIGKALNLAVNLAVEKKYEFVLTMDQDSSFTEIQIQKYLTCFNKIDLVNIGMVGINYAENLGACNQEDCTVTEVTTLITSGSILSTQAFKQVDAFNEDLFIDGVDHEYCLKLILAKFKVLSFQHIFLSHNLGIQKDVKNWGIGKKVMRNTHSPLRFYYITRNYLYLNKKYKRQFPVFCASLRKEIFQKMKNGILYESEKIAYFKSFFRAVMDFRKGKLGKLS